MDFQNTINEIFSHLTGDNQADIKYLQEQMKKYKGNEHSTEIIRAIAR